MHHLCRGVWQLNIDPEHILAAAAEIYLVRQRFDRVSQGCFLARDLTCWRNFLNLGGVQPTSNTTLLHRIQGGDNAFMTAQDERILQVQFLPIQSRPTCKYGSEHKASGHQR
jgi:hypothetical protein